MNILKRSRVNSFIEIWSENYINEIWRRSSKDMDAEILQVAYACENKYIVEFVRNPNKEENKRVLVEEDLEK